MRLTVQQAADIAKANGLRLDDARSLLMLASTTEEAERLAAQFADDNRPPKDRAADAIRNYLTGDDPQVTQALERSGYQTQPSPDPTAANTAANQHEQPQ